MSLVGALNNHDGTYDFTFDATVTLVNPVASMPGIIMLDPHTGIWWPSTSLSAVSATVIRFQAGDGGDDANFVNVIGQPTRITAANPFNTTNGVIPIF